MMKLLNRKAMVYQVTYSLLVKSQKAASQIVTIVCALFFVGCDNDSNDVAPERARLLKITPAISDIERFTPEMELVFDKPVSQVKVNGIDAQPDSSMPAAVWNMDLSHFEQLYPQGSTEWPSERFCLTVSYTDESGSYQENLDCAELPHLIVEPNPPTVIGGTVKDGDVGVDAEKLNIYGITLQFSEEVTGYLAIRPEGEGEYLGWNVEWSKDGFGDSVRLHRLPGGGKKLLNGTVYIIEFELTDRVGNVLRGEITFTTKE